MLQVAKLRTDGVLNILGDLDERSPQHKSGLLAHFPFDGDIVGIGNPSRNLTPDSDWIIGNGSPWGSNGAAEKTKIIEGFDPFGKIDAIMRALDTDVTSTADGGWSAKSFPVDPTKAYKIFTFVKRVTDHASGTFYIGVTGSAVRNRADGSINTNPYVSVISASDIKSGYGKNIDSNDWLLVVSKIVPHDTSNNWAVDNESGVYSMTGEKIANTTEFKWVDANITTCSTRSYLYYSTDIGNEQHWSHPGVFVVDGTEPKVKDLLEGKLNAYNPLHSENVSITSEGLGLGKANTNYVTNAKDMLSWSPYNNGFTETFMTEFETIGYRMSKKTSWNGVYRNVTIPSTGIYTISAYFRYIDGTALNNGATVYISGYGASDTAVAVDKAKKGEWQRISITVNVTDPDLVFRLYLISYGGTQPADWSSWEVTMPKVEAGNYPTPFSEGASSPSKFVVDFSPFDIKSKTSWTVEFEYYHPVLTTFGTNIVFATSYNGSAGSQWFGLNASSGYTLNPFGVASDPNKWNKAVFKYNGTSTEFYLNGVLVGTYSGKLFFNGSDMLSFSSMYGWNSTTYLASHQIRNLSVWDNYVDESAIPKSTVLTREGDLILDSFYKDLPMNVDPTKLKYFPLTSDGRSYLDDFKEKEIQNLDYFDFSMGTWIGASKTNMWAAGKTRFSWTSGTGVVTRDIPVKEMAPPIDFPGVEVVKVENTSDEFATILWTVPGIEGPGVDYTHSIWVYLVEGDSIGIGQHWNPWSHNHKRYVPKNKWTRIEVTMPTVDNTNLSIAMEYYVNKIGGGGKAYFCAPQFEKSKWSSPFVDGTRGINRLTLPYDIIDCKQDFTIFGWWFPKTYADSMYRPCLTRNRLTSNSTYNRILIMGNGTTSYRLRAWLSSDGATETSIYAPDTVPVKENEWNFFFLRRSGGNMSIGIGNSGGFGIGTAAAASYLDQDEDPATWGWKIGEYNFNDHLSEAFHKDYCFAQMSISDSELEEIFRNKMKQYTNKLLNGRIIEEGDFV